MMHSMKCRYLTFLLSQLSKKCLIFLAILYKQKTFIHFLFIELLEVEKIHLFMVDERIYCGIINISQVGHDFVG